jgi:hypothetical protein
MKALEDENRRLKQMVADQALRRLSQNMVTSTAYRQAAGFLRG